MFSNRIILYQQQIERINWLNQQKAATGLIDLLDEEATTKRQMIEALLEDGLAIPREPRYDKVGNAYGKDFYEPLIQRITAGLSDDTQALRYAVVITNSFLRTVPTMAGSYRAGEWGELDRFAVSLLKLGEPVLVYCQDGSGAWSLVRSSQCCGWMLTEHLAWEDDFFRWRQYSCNREQVIVADSRHMINYTDFAGKWQQQELLMGTRLPCYDASSHSFVLGLPTKDDRGKLAMLQLMVERDGRYLPGWLPLSEQNIISQAKKLLGESYGWGGTDYHRDCTSFIVDIFSVFGLQLPRNSSQQMAMQGVEQCPKQREAKYQFIAALEPGSVLYFPGHAMLYLRQNGAQLEILHNVYAIGLPAADKIIPHKIRRVVQGNLQQHRVSGELLLDAVTACWAPAHQKKFLCK